MNDILPKIIYHYCDARAAISILCDRKLWLSSFSMSNDYQEGMIGKDAVMAEATRDTRYPHVREAFEIKLRNIDRILGTYGMCFSEHGDLLSQWRGYADNGAGFAIGFDTSVAGWLQRPEPSLPNVQNSSARIQRVLYRPDEHAAVAASIYEVMTPHLAELRPVPPASSDVGSPSHPWLQSHSAVNTALHKHWPDIYRLKNEAFKEEAEWRAIAIAMQLQAGFQFRAARGKVVPYIEHTLPDHPELNPIRQIVIGPRNTTPDHIVGMMLEGSGLAKHVDVRRSNASYRD